MTREELSVDR
jgi:ATP-binding cassette, subfamily A (ABC1), member 3